MAIQLLPLLGALARGAVMSGPRAIGAFGRAGASLLGGSGLSQPLNIAALARQLGTPNPSPAQIQAAQQQQQQNSGYGLRAAGHHAGHGIMELGKFTMSLGVATKGLSALGEVANNRAAQELRVFNPQYAKLAAERERADMKYAMQRGRATSASASALGDSLMRNQREWAPYFNAGEILANSLAKFAVDVLIGAEGLLEKVGITGAVKKWVEENEEKKRKGQSSLHTYIQEQLNGTRQRPLSNRPNETPGSRI